MAVETRGYTTTDGIDINEVLYDTVLPILDIYNAEEILDIRAMVCFDWTEAYYKFPINEKWKFQKLAEAEKPTSRKIVYGKRQKDTEKYGLGITYTFDWLMSEQASSSEIAKLAAKALSTDRDVITSTVLDGCLNNGGTDGWYNGSFNSNEKIDRPPQFGSKTFGTSHSHYNATGATTLALSDITAAKEHLKEHGYKGVIYGFCNSDMTKDIEDLAGFFKTTTATYIAAGKLTDEVVIDGWAGRLLGINWKETEWMPDSYFLLIGTRAGEDKPIMFIQKKNPSAHGLILTPGSYDVRYPLIDASYLRWFTTQVAYRGAGIAYYIATSYSNPSLTTTTVD